MYQGTCHNTTCGNSRLPLVKCEPPPLPSREKFLAAPLYLWSSSIRSVIFLLYNHVNKTTRTKFCISWKRTRLTQLPGMTFTLGFGMCRGSQCEVFYHIYVKHMTHSGRLLILKTIDHAAATLTSFLRQSVSVTHDDTNMVSRCCTI